MPAKKNKKDQADRDLKAEIEKSAKMFDVAKPGQSRASATSRPIIVGHSGMLKNDPMMKGDEKEKEDEIKIWKHSKTVIPPGEEESSEDSAAIALQEPAKGSDHVETSPNHPGSDDDAGDRPDKKTDSATANEVREEKNSDESETTEKDISLDKAEETTEGVDDDSDTLAKTSDSSEQDQEKAQSEESITKKGVVDSLVNEVGNKKADQKAKDEMAAKAAEAEKLVQSKKYFVPIGQVSRRRSHRLGAVLIIFIVFFCLLVLNIAADAEVIDLGINPLTDLL